VDSDTDFVSTVVIIPPVDVVVVVLSSVFPPILLLAVEKENRLHCCSKQDRENRVMVQIRIRWHLLHLQTEPRLKMERIDFFKTF